MTVEPRPFVHVRAPVRCALALAAVVLAGASLASAQGVCDRTPAVRDAIVDATGGLYNCAEITAAHLAAIESLDLTNYGVTTLKAGDFQGMSPAAICTCPVPS